MSSQEVKGTLAKLLATENLIVEHRVVQTASFDVDRRVLVLPIWDVSDRVYNMLVGHEVGHALFTPNTEWSTLEVPKGYINITEDARIEKLMKRKFPGLSKDFFEGYKQLDEDDFFDVVDTDVTKLLLIDRINLYFKIGAHRLFPFDDAEVVLRDAVGAAETFEEALSAARAIYAYEKNKKDEMDKLPSLPDQQETEDFNIDGSSGDSTGESSSEESQETSSKGKGEEKSEENSENGEGDDGESAVGKQGSTGGVGDPLDSKTDDALAQNLKDKALLADHLCPKYLEISNIDINHHTVSADEVNQASQDQWGADQYTDPNHDYYRPLDWSDVDADYRKFKKDCSREVNYLAKEFEMKKAATAFSRESIAKTGVLDTGKLHTYKFNDDIFKKVTVRPDGKNHGMIFLLDWSGSMSECIHDTYKQLLSLCLFCRKSGIPFDVYAFVQDGQWMKPLEDEKWEGKEGTFYMPPNFYLLNFLNGKLNNQKFDQYARDIWRVTYQYNFRYSHRHRNPWLHDAPTKNIPDVFPKHLQLGGTPLNEAIVCLQSLIPDFQRKTKVEKVHVAILSDGEAAYSAEWRKSTWGGKEELNRSCIRYNTHIRDRRNGRTYAPNNNDRGGCTTTNQLLRYLKGRFPQCNFLGFRIATSRDVTRYLENEFYPDYVKVERYKKTFSKFKSLGAPMMGYQELYFLNNKSLNTDVEFEPKSDSKADIKRAFTKSLKGKANNKKILSSFILQIA